MNKYRTHYCNQLNKKNSKEKVKLSGWIHNVRDHGSILFVDLRDHYGITQVVFDKTNEQLMHLISSLNYESVISVTGVVENRLPENCNNELATGEIEVIVQYMTVLTKSEQIPFPVNSKNINCAEEIRLKHRYLDLRRTDLHQRIQLRSNVISKIRELMTKEGFLEMQTPILTASSPEGARDFLVPSRLHQGKFYALPQAPQQFKQMLMISGFDKYFQIAPCFRDEDSRADRSPGEFYQLDMEMSFVEQEDIFRVTEKILIETFEYFSNKKINKPFPRITYEDSLKKYGNDKPDLRNPIIIQDVTDIFRNSNCKIFANAIKQQNSVVKAIIAPNSVNKNRQFPVHIEKFAIEHCNARGLGYLQFEEDVTLTKGPIAKFLTNQEIEQIKHTVSGQDRDYVFFCCDAINNATHIAGMIRTKLAEELNLIDENQFAFCWITDFPIYEFNDKTNKIEFSHNPFSMPQIDLQQLEKMQHNKAELLKLKAYQYDIVCNGIELSSGAIRNHQLDLLYKTFEIAGYSKEDVNSNFVSMVSSLRFGPPPHGGLAPGIDRIVMLLAETHNIREVIAFPMNQQAQDLLMGAPCTVTEAQLKELGISIAHLKK